MSGSTTGLGDPLRNPKGCLERTTMARDDLLSQNS
jgi:hypothetical protein